MAEVFDSKVETRHRFHPTGEGRPLAGWQRVPACRRVCSGSGLPVTAGTNNGTCEGTTRATDRLTLAAIASLGTFAFPYLVMLSKQWLHEKPDFTESRK